MLPGIKSSPLGYVSQNKQLSFLGQNQRERIQTASIIKQAFTMKIKLVIAFLKRAIVVMIKYISCLRSQMYFRDNAFLIYRSFVRSHSFIVQSFYTQVTCL
jgi:hypothetical protein